MNGRDKYQLMRDYLEAVGIHHHRVRIMYRMNATYQNVLRFEKMSINLGLVTVDSTGRRLSFEVTSRGYEFLKLMRVLYETFPLD